MQNIVSFFFRGIVFLFKFLTGYYFIFLLIFFLKKIFFTKSITFPLIYTKATPIELDAKAVKRVQFCAQFIFTIFATSIIAFILINNLAPLGVTMRYVMGDGTDSITPLGPSDRVHKETYDGQKIYYQSHNISYFSTKMPFAFDTATVKVIFQNADPNQTISIGFKDQEAWHYSTILFDVPILNTLSWNKVTSSTGQVLYQREPHFSSINDFISHPPQEGLIGTYDYDPGIGDYFHLRLPDYQPAKVQTVIDTPLRGKQTLFVYVDNEPFIMKILKQDLNWYEDPDVMTVKVYKNNILVYQVTAPDDGIEDDSKKVLAPQEVTIKNPGPGLPESGVYKVIVDANNDTLIKRITTNLHKIVFQGSIFPVANSDIYSRAIASTSATTVYTNALTLSAMTYHEKGKQIISVGHQQVPLSEVNTDIIITPKDNFTKVQIPLNDILLKGYWGYFAFDPSQFFIPVPYRSIPINSQDDVGIIDYVFTNYIPPIVQGNWKVAERTFDIRNAYIQNGQLSWIIQAPKLQDGHGQILIKDVIVTLRKKSWF